MSTCTFDGTRDVAPTENLVERLVAHAQKTLPAGEEAAPTRAYEHMGAVLSDVGLQAATNYRTVVRPRVLRLQRAWPTACSTSSFLDKVLRFGLSDVLRWRHPEKLTRVVRLALLLQSERVDTVDELSIWIEAGDARGKLLAVPGIGPKSADYLANLAGSPRVAVDRHIRRFVEGAGLAARDYGVVRDLVSETANRMGLTPSALDRAIWSAMTAK